MQNKLFAKYFPIVTICVAVLAIAFIISINYGMEDQTYSTILLSVTVSPLIAIYLFWIYKSCKIVNAESIGCVLEFGKPVMQIGPGLNFVPAWFCELRIESRLAIEELFPHDDYDKSPIRIIHGSSKEATGDPLDTRLTTSVSLICRYKISDYVSFIQSIGNRWELKKQVKDILVSITQIECSKFSVSINLGRFEEINYILKSAMEKTTVEWGIEIINVQLQNIDLGNAINEAQTNVSISAINKEVNRNNAQKIIYDGFAEAEVSKAFQFAKAQGIKKVAEELGIDEKLAIYQIDTLANVLRKNNADLNLYGNNLSELFGMVMSVYKSSQEAKLPSNNA